MNLKLPGLLSGPWEEPVQVPVTSGGPTPERNESSSESKGRLSVTAVLWE